MSEGATINGRSINPIVRNNHSSFDDKPSIPGKQKEHQKSDVHAAAATAVGPKLSPRLHNPAGKLYPRSVSPAAKPLSGRQRPLKTSRKMRTSLSSSSLSSKRTP